MSTISVTFYVCDKAGCNKRIEGSSSSLVGGISGYVVDNSIPTNVSEKECNWFACRDSHISGAVSTVLNRQRQKYSHLVKV
jgi:hypothetical protein